MSMILDPRPYQLICEGCKEVGRFKDADEAFNLGWDGPPQFTVVVCCPKCSAAEILIERDRRKTLCPLPLTLQQLAEAMIAAGHARATVDPKPR